MSKSSVPEDMSEEQFKQINGVAADITPEKSKEPIHIMIHKLVYKTCNINKTKPIFDTVEKSSTH